MLSERKMLNSAREVRLTIAGLQTNVAPGILYDIYVGAPAAEGRAATRIFVGVISFFDAVRSLDHAQHDGAMELPSFSFDVSAAAIRIRNRGNLEVTIAPHGKPASGAQPIIGEIQLFGDER